MAIDVNTRKPRRHKGGQHSRPHRVTPQPYLRIGFLVHDVSRMRRTLFDQRLKELNITRAQWSALAALSRRDGMTQTDLAHEMEIGKVVIGGLVDRLETSGIVERKSDPADRRTRRVYITESGFEIVEQMQFIARELNSVIMKGLAFDQIHIAENVLHAMKVNLRKALNKDDDQSRRTDDTSSISSRTPTSS